MKIELLELPFTEQRRFRLRVKGAGSRKMPVASKTEIMRRWRAWRVRQ